MTGATRLGCLYMPDFRIQVHRRDDGLDPSKPLLLIGRSARRQVVAAASLEAVRDGARAGMTLAQAEAACPTAQLREEDPVRYASAGQSLLTRLHNLTPVVEAVRLGLYFLGTRGIRWLYDDEAALLRSALDAIRDAGLAASAAAAGTRFTALCAALVTAPGTPPCQVRSGEDRLFLAPLPLTLLPDPGDLLERLAMLGITTLGALAALPPRSVERRYGARGARLYRLARAEDGAHLSPTPLPTVRQYQALLEAPADNAEGLLFVLSPLIEALLEALIHEGRACAAIGINLRLEGGGTLELPLLLGAPVTAPKPVIDLLRLKLARVTLSAGVIEARIEATQVTEPSTPQGDLFRRTGSPSGMAVTVARLVDALGPEAVVVSDLADSYRPDRTFVLQAAKDGAPGLLHPSAKAGAINDAPSQRSLRRCDPPRALEVHTVGDLPDALYAGGRRWEVSRRAGPFRFGGEWWGPGYARDYFQLQLSDGAELLVFRDLNRSAWFLEGIYD